MRRFPCAGTTKALASSRCRPAMHHCVKTYWRHVINGTSRIYSILEDGNRVATLELFCQHSNYKRRSSPTAEKSRRYHVRQLAGPYNARPAPEVAKAVGRFVEAINNWALVE